MNISPLGIAIIQFFEEYRDKAYRHFPHEPWTCGWGHTKGVTETTTCTPEIALQWLENDIAEASSVVNTLGYELTQHQFDALVSLGYNIGSHNLVTATGFLAAVSSKRYVEAGERFLSFDHINGVENLGLKRRRTLEKALFLDGVT
jgi:lysozyme